MVRSIDLTQKALRTRSTNSYKGMTKLCHVSALCTITSYNNAHDAVVCEQKMFPKKLGCGSCSQIGQQLIATACVGNGASAYEPSRLTGPRNGRSASI